MKGINKQKAGFKFGVNRLTVLNTIGQVSINGRVYRLVEVQTADGLIYRSLRLYNKDGKFIKQMLYEPRIGQELIGLMSK